MEITNIHINRVDMDLVIATTGFGCFADQAVVCASCSPSTKESKDWIAAERRSMHGPVSKLGCMFTSS